MHTDERKATIVTLNFVQMSAVAACKDLKPIMLPVLQPEMPVPSSLHSPGC